MKGDRKGGEVAASPPISSTESRCSAVLSLAVGGRSWRRYLYASIPITHEQHRNFEIFTGEEVRNGLDGPFSVPLFGRSPGR